MVYVDYKMAKAQQHILLCSTCIIIFGKMMSSHASFPFHDFDTKDCVIKNNQLSQVIKCTNQKGRNSKGSQNSENLLSLIDIESTDCGCNNAFHKTNENIFFIESSSRNHLRPRDACAIESAILQNAGMGRYIVVGMTSPVLDISANNATCQLYTKYYGKYLIFRHINVNTIFKGTPLHQFHIDGKLISADKKLTTYQYR